MRTTFSALVLATSFALLVPDNRGQAVRAEMFAPIAAAQSVAAPPAMSEMPATAGPQVPPEMTWLLALGFLGVVIARRVRPG